MTFKSAIHRAAVLIKGLPQDQAAKVLGYLNTKDLQRVFREIRELAEVPEHENRLAQSKFIQQMSEVSTNPSVLQKSNESAPFKYLNKVSPEVGFRVLLDEHPAIVAIAISYMSTKAATALLQQFDAVQRVSILRRLFQLDSMGIRNDKQASEHVHRRLKEILNSEMATKSGMEVATKLLSCIDSSTRSTCLEFIASEDSAMAAQVSGNIFRFSDIERLSNSDVKKILSWVDTSLWAPALRNSTRQIRKKILGNMAERARVILAREIETLNAIDTPTSNQAKSQIVQAILDLSDRQVVDLKSPVDVNLERRSKAA